MRKLILLLVVGWFLFIPSRIQAAEEFSTSYDVTYEIGNDGISRVTQKITLKNLTSQYYASNFTLTIGSTTVEEISATDGLGPMETNVEVKDNKTAISVKFNQQIVGVDKTQTFTIKFKSKDFAQAIGKTWEVNLPKIPESKNIDDYNLVLSVPLGFGDPTSIVPSPKKESQTYNRLFYTFDKEQLRMSGVSLNFGTTQVFDFTLKYNLENTTLFPAVTSITLPPDTDYQDVILARINPEPMNVTVDEDGNYLAWYKMPRRSSQEITVIGSAKLYISDKDKKKIPSLGDKATLWTKSDRYWEKENPAIQAAVREIFKEGMPKTNKEKARLIYRYVVDILKYDTSRLNSSNIERLGAVTALNNPNSAVCMEFTDLFIALTRAVDVPSREVDGFAYSLNRSLRPLSLSRDLLHAWPEYFDEKEGWIMVDPTWENTSGGVDYFNKFDLNHLTLVKKGASSQAPYTSDDVKVVLSENDFSPAARMEVTLEVPQTIWAGFPAVALIKVVNQGNSSQPPSTLQLTTQKIDILGANPVYLGIIPPFGSTAYRYNLKTPFVWQDFEDTVELDIGGEKISKKVIVKPFFLFSPFPYIFLGVIVVILGVYGTIFVIHLRRKEAD